MFLTRKHAERHHSDQFVYNGLDWDSYGPVDLGAARKHVHYLAKASRLSKNLKGAIDVAAGARVTLAVMGGRRLNIGRGVSLSLSPWARFHGMVGGREKAVLLNGSRGHIFPVRWHEPFGLALIESFYFGCPTFGTPYGSLPELVTPDSGHLSTSCRELVEAVRSNSFDPHRCHAYARDLFDAERMATGYLSKYETILSGRTLHAVRPYLAGTEAGLLPWTA